MLLICSFSGISVQSKKSLLKLVFQEAVLLEGDQLHTKSFQFVYLQISYSTQPKALSKTYQTSDPVTQGGRTYSLPLCH